VIPCLLALLVLLSSPSIAAETLPGPIEAWVLRTIDGDTLLVRARVWLGQDVTTHVRLLGIDAPELRGKCEAETAAAGRARDYVAAMIGKRPVTLTDLRVDKYGGRVLARVTAGGRDVSAALLRAGLAQPYRGGKRAGWCRI
jgi:micrococcal nuclease